MGFPWVGMGALIFKRLGGLQTLLVWKNRAAPSFVRLVTRDALGFYWVPSMLPESGVFAQTGKLGK